MKNIKFPVSGELNFVPGLEEYFLLLLPFTTFPFSSAKASFQKKRFITKHLGQEPKSFEY